MLEACERIEIEGCDTIPKLFWHQVKARDGRTAFREKDLGIWRATSWRDYGQSARWTGMGLARLGLARGEVVSILADTVPGILASPAFRHDGLLIVTFDESDSEGGDATRCCREPRGPNIKPGAMLVFGPTDKVPDTGPGVTGPGGGRIGAVLVSPLIKPGTVSKTPYNHYALLKSIEDVFGLAHLGYAGQKGLKSFGRDIFNADGPEHQHP